MTSPINAVNIPQSECKACTSLPTWHPLFFYPTARRLPATPTQSCSTMSVCVLQRMHASKHPSATLALASGSSSYLHTACHLQLQRHTAATASCSATHTSLVKFQCNSMNQAAAEQSNACVHSCLVQHSSGPQGHPWDSPVRCSVWKLQQHKNTRPRAQINR